MTTISPSRITSRTRSSCAIEFASASKRLIRFFVFDENRPCSSSTYSVPRNPSSFSSYSQSRPRGTSRTSFGRMGFDLRQHAITPRSLLSHRRARTFVPWSHSLWLRLPFICSVHSPPITQLLVAWRCAARRRPLRANTSAASHASHRSFVCASARSTRGSTRPLAASPLLQSG